jgi:hypothetical protein
MTKLGRATATQRPDLADNPLPRLREGSGGGMRATGARQMASPHPDLPPQAGEGVGGAA